MKWLSWVKNYPTLTIWLYTLWQKECWPITIVIVAPVTLCSANWKDVGADLLTIVNKVCITCPSCEARLQSLPVKLAKVENDFVPLKRNSVNYKVLHFLLRVTVLLHRLIKQYRTLSWPHKQRSRDYIYIYIHLLNLVATTTILILLRTSFLFLRDSSKYKSVFIHPSYFFA